MANGDDDDDLSKRMVRDPNRPKDPNERRFVDPYDVFAGGTPVPQTSASDQALFQGGPGMYDPRVGLLAATNPEGFAAGAAARGVPPPKEDMPEGITHEDARAHLSKIPMIGGALAGVRGLYEGYQWGKPIQASPLGGPPPTTVPTPRPVEEEAGRRAREAAGAAYEAVTGRSPSWRYGSVGFEGAPGIPGSAPGSTFPPSARELSGAESSWNWTTPGATLNAPQQAVEGRPVERSILGPMAGAAAPMTGWEPAPDSVASPVASPTSPNASGAVPEEKEEAKAHGIGAGEAVPLPRPRPSDESLHDQRVADETAAKRLGGQPKTGGVPAPKGDRAQPGAGAKGDAMDGLAKALAGVHAITPNLPPPHVTSPAAPHPNASWMRGAQAANDRLLAEMMGLTKPGGLGGTLHLGEALRGKG